MVIPAVLSACGLVGCGGGLPPVAPVQGVVMLAGAPLAEATVIFTTKQPVAGFGPLVATGKTDAAGRFTLITRVDARRSVPGAVVGQHGVTVSAFAPPDGMTEAAYQAQVAAHQEQVKSQGLIAAGTGPGPWVSRLKPEFSDASRTPLTASVASDGRNELTFAVERANGPR